MSPARISRESEDYGSELYQLSQIRELLAAILTELRHMNDKAT
jgi:hypothetical protein